MCVCVRRSHQSLLFWVPLPLVVKLNEICSGSTENTSFPFLSVWIQRVFFFFTCISFPHPEYLHYIYMTVCIIIMRCFPECSCCFTVLMFNHKWSEITNVHWIYTIHIRPLISSCRRWLHSGFITFGCCFYSNTIICHLKEQEITCFISSVLASTSLLVLQTFYTQKHISRIYTPDLVFSYYIFYSDWFRAFEDQNCF